MSYCINTDAYFLIQNSYEQSLSFKILFCIDLVVGFLTVVFVIVERLEHRAKRRAKSMAIKAKLTPEFLRNLIIEHENKSPTKTEDRTENQVTFKFPIRDIPNKARQDSDTHKKSKPKTKEELDITVSKISSELNASNSKQIVNDKANAEPNNEQIKNKSSVISKKAKKIVEDENPQKTLEDETQHKASSKEENLHKSEEVKFNEKSLRSTQ